MTSEGQELNDLIERWSFHWGIMEVLIGGRSSIDLANLLASSWEESSDFLNTYGFDLSRSDDQKTLHGIIIESWSFIQNHLMPIEWANGNRPPSDLLMADDPRVILMAASDRSQKNAHRQKWACCALKLMHTIAHIDGIQRLLDQTAAYQQIMERFYRYLFRDDAGELFFGRNHKEAVSLSHVEWKHRKTRDSMILKLLHKPANVAETIYDMVGVRIVTKNLSDVMIAVKFLHDLNIVSFANCSPRRARNTLIDAENFRLSLESLLALVKAGQIPVDEFPKAVDTVISKNALSYDEPSNPHSSQEYRSIHLTCRQMIRYPDPSKFWLIKLEEALKRLSPDDPKRKSILEILKVAGTEEVAQKTPSEHFHNTSSDDEIGSHGRYELSGFFPFEVQLMDVESYHKNMSGDRKHSVYKTAQVKTARKRILGSVLSDGKVSK